MRFRFPQMFVSIVLLCGAPFAHANQLDMVLEQLIKQYDIPGMAVVMLDGDRIIESAAVGVRVRGGEAAVGIEPPDFGLLLTALNTSHPSGGLCKFFVMFSVISFTFGMTFFSIIALKSCDDENGELPLLKL